LDRENLIYDGIEGFKAIVTLPSGKRKVIVLPPLTINTNSPILEQWTPFRQINRISLDGTKHISCKGFHLKYILNIPYFPREYLPALKMLANYSANSEEPIIVIPHSDYPSRQFKMRVTGDYSLGWVEGWAVGHSLQMTLEGVELYKNNPTVGNDIITHWSSTDTVYLESDDGIRQWAASGCPWGFNEFEEDYQPEQFTYTGSANVKARRLFVNEKSMYCQNNAGYILNMGDLADGAAKTSMLFSAAAGSVSLLFRITDFNNAYYLDLNYTGTVTLRKMVAGSPTTLVTYTLSDYDKTLTTDQWYGLKAVFDGDEIKSYIRERIFKQCVDAFGRVSIGGAIYTRWEFLGTVTDATYTTGRCGVKNGDNVSYSKNLDVEDKNGEYGDYSTNDLQYVGYWCESFEPKYII